MKRWPAKLAAGHMTCSLSRSNSAVKRVVQPHGWTPGPQMNAAPVFNSGLNDLREMNAGLKRERYEQSNALGAGGDVRCELKGHK